MERNCVISFHLVCKPNTPTRLRASGRAERDTKWDISSHCGAMPRAATWHTAQPRLNGASRCHACRDQSCSSAVRTALFQLGSTRRTRWLRETTSAPVRGGGPSTAGRRSSPAAPAASGTYPSTPPFFPDLVPASDGFLLSALDVQARGGGGAGGARGGRAHVLPEGSRARRALEAVGSQGIPRHRLRLRRLRARPARAPAPRRRRPLRRQAGHPRT